MIGKYNDLQSALYKRMAEAYYNLIISLKDDVVLKAGLQEGLNKFLSNAYIFSIREKGKHGKYKQAHKYLTSQYISKKADTLIKDNNFKFDKLSGQLRFEHIIPKKIYQENMIEGIRNGTMKVEDIEAILNKYWLIATITKEEDDNLIYKDCMPEGWVYTGDMENTKIRYSEQHNKKGEKIIIYENLYLEDLYIEL